MQLKQRIKKLEQITGATDNFCRCGTPYFVTFVIGGENITRNVCPDCGRRVKPITRADFGNVSIKFNHEYEVIKPKSEFTRKEFEEWQNTHVISAHGSYQDYLEQQKAV